MTGGTKERYQNNGEKQTKREKERGKEIFEDLDRKSGLRFDGGKGDSRLVYKK